MFKILKHFFKFLFISPDKLEKIHKEILSVIGAEEWVLEDRDER